MQLWCPITSSSASNRVCSQDVWSWLVKLIILSSVGVTFPNQHNSALRTEGNTSGDWEVLGSRRLEVTGDPNKSHTEEKYKGTRRGKKQHESYRHPLETFNYWREAADRPIAEGCRVEEWFLLCFCLAIIALMTETLAYLRAEGMWEGKGRWRQWAQPTVCEGAVSTSSPCDQIPLWGA